MTFLLDAEGIVREVIAACREVTGHPIPAQVGPRRPGDPPELVADGQRLVEADTGENVAPDPALEPFASVGASYDGASPSDSASPSASMISILYTCLTRCESTAAW